MTSGNSGGMNNFSWSIRSKKRHRSGSGGAKDHESKKKTFSSKGITFGSRRSTSAVPAALSSLEVVAPVTSDVEFKFTWPVEGFLKHVKNGFDANTTNSNNNNNDGKTTANEGIDSKSFDININGVNTTWNLSIRFWTGEGGEHLANPFVLCLNMLSCNIAKPTTVGIKFKFGVLNRTNGEFEFGGTETKPELKLETTFDLKCIGYKNIAISNKHVDANGNISLVSKMKLLKDDSRNHSLSSDLGSLINDEKSSDLILEAGGRKFKVHSNILSARSPVFASILKKAEGKLNEEPEEEEPEEEKQENDIPPPLTSQEDFKEEEEEDEKCSCNKQQASSSSSSSITNNNDCKLNPIEIKNEKKTIKLKDLKAETLGELLTYIYTDCSVNVDMMATALLAAAVKFQLPGLKVNCEQHFDESISPGNVASVLLLADQYKCGNLKKNALGYCKDNHTYIMKDSAWKRIEEEKPELFQEAVSEVVSKSSCQSHTECLKKKGKRFEIERNSSIILEVDKEE